MICLAGILRAYTLPTVTVTGVDQDAHSGLVTVSYTLSASAIVTTDILLDGVRFAGLTGAPDIVWQECGKWCDVVTLNVYPCAQLEENVMRENFREDARPLTEALAEKYRLCQRPILITE